MTCELCTKKHPKEIWRDDTVYVIDAGDDDIPGYIRVILNEHVAEMSDLPDDVRIHVMDVVNRVEKTMRRVMKPTKVNLAQFGNMVPHLHWHVIARYSDDAFFPGSTWSAKVRTCPEQVVAQRRELALQMIRELPADLG